VKEFESQGIITAIEGVRFPSKVLDAKKLGSHHVQADPKETTDDLTVRKTLAEINQSR
jgi:hypothetical protein